MNQHQYAKIHEDIEGAYRATVRIMSHIQKTADRKGPEFRHAYSAVRSLYPLYVESLFQEWLENDRIDRGFRKRWCKEHDISDHTDIDAVYHHFEQQALKYRG